MSNNKILEGEKEINLGAVIAVLGAICSIVALPIGVIALGIPLEKVIIWTTVVGLICISYIAYFLISNHFLYMREIYDKVKNVDIIVEAKNELKAQLDKICDTSTTELIDYFVIINGQAPNANIVIIVNAKTDRHFELRVSSKKIELFEFSQISLPDEHKFNEIDMKKLPKDITNDEPFICCPITTHVGLNIALLEVKVKSAETKPKTQEIFFTLIDKDKEIQIVNDKKYTI